MKLARKLFRFGRRQDGTSTVEFAFSVPIVLMILFSSIDYGVVMLRQVFLDRAVDIAVREVRLGNVSADGYTAFRDLICARTFMLNNCANNIAIEMRTVDRNTFDGLDAPAQCVNRAENIQPVVEFNPNAGPNEIVIIRVCVVADPFIALTGIVLGMPRDASGGYNIVSRGAFANEPV